MSSYSSHILITHRSFSFLLVFVPNGWPHLVLNLELTVAVTHNYASEFGPFYRMWREVVIDEPDFARRWFRGLIAKRQDLATKIIDYHTRSAKDGEEWASQFVFDSET